MNVLQLKVTDVFHTITNGGRQSLVYASSEEKTYSDARAQCQSMGGYLIEFDSPEEYDVVLDWVIDISSGSISFVGFNDIAVEDEWVTDRDNNTPVIPENLLWYSDWPDNKDGDEDCGVVFHMKPSWLGDISCSRNELYLCEKDV